MAVSKREKIQYNRVYIFVRLPEGVLSELQFTSKDFMRLTELLQRQTNIKELNLQDGTLPFNVTRNDVQINSNFIDHLHLESLYWATCKLKFDIASILNKQPKLKYLHLDDNVDDKVMESVSNLTHLESLTINVKDTPAKSIANIRKLLNLKHLSLRYSHNVDMAVFDAITRLNNDRITSMDIGYYSNITADQIGSLSKSVSKLKYLRCKYEHGTFGAVMEHFNFVQVLHFVGNVRYVIDQDDIYFEDNELCVNPNLVEMRISFPVHSQLLEKLAKDCPNITRLKFESGLPMTSSELGLILNGFPKIESVAILGSAGSELKQGDFGDGFKNGMNKLKFLWIMGLDPTLKEMFSEVFDVVRGHP